MTDDQIQSAFGVEESMHMLQFREQLKSQMTPELYEQNMNVHKASIRMMMGMNPGIQPIDAADKIVASMDADTKMDDDQREMWKALVVVAAFEMQEF
jgi:hypothetical protein